MTDAAVPGLIHRKDNKQDRWAFTGLLGLLVWAPIPLASNRTWALGILLLWSIILCGMCAWNYRHATETLYSRLLTYRTPLLLLGAFSTWAVLQTIPVPAEVARRVSAETWTVWRAPFDVFAGPKAMPLSLDPFQGHLYATASFVYLSVFVVTLCLANSARRLQWLAVTLVMSGVIQALFGIAMFSKGSEYQLFFADISHQRILGTFRYHNSMAGYMELCLSVGIGLMLAQLGNLHAHPGWRRKTVAALRFVLSAKMLLRAMLVIMVIALVLTRSRMGNSAFFAAMLLVGFAAIVLKRHAAPAAIWLISSLIVIDILVIGTWIGLEKVVSRVQETTLSTSVGKTEDSIEQRSVVPRAAISIIQDFPLAGTGGGSFYSAFFRYRPSEIAAYFEHTHNDYLEIAGDTGLVGLGLLMAFAAYCAGTFIQVLRKRHDHVFRGMAFGSLMALVSIGIHGFVDFNLQIPSNALTLTAILAMGLAAAGLEHKESQLAGRHQQPEPPRDTKSDVLT